MPPFIVIGNKTEIEHKRVNVKRAKQIDDDIDDSSFIDRS